MNMATVQRLDEARSKAGIPFIITSGCRCEAQNATVGGAPSSSHLIGRAVDIRSVYSRQRLLIVRSLLAVGFNRIGIYSGHVHADDDPNAPPDVMWYSRK
jgi:uncharacterized protein YcbK (DUF882 family)